MGNFFTNPSKAKLAWTFGGLIAAIVVAVTVALLLIFKVSCKDAPKCKECPAPPPPCEVCPDTTGSCSDVQSARLLLRILRDMNSETKDRAQLGTYETEVDVQSLTAQVLQSQINTQKVFVSAIDAFVKNSSDPVIAAVYPKIQEAQAAFGSAATAATAALTLGNYAVDMGEVYSQLGVANLALLEVDDGFSSHV